jgi:hypothetical protein
MDYSGYAVTDADSSVSVVPMGITSEEETVLMDRLYRAFVVFKRRTIPGYYLQYGEKSRNRSMIRNVVRSMCPRFEPEDIVAAIFEHYAKPWLTHLSGTVAESLTRSYADKRKLKAAKEIKWDMQFVHDRIQQGVSLREILEDGTNGLNVSSRYAVALDKGLLDLVDLFRTDAILELKCRPGFVEFYGRFLPEDVQKEVGYVTTHV